MTDFSKSTNFENNKTNLNLPILAICTYLAKLFMQINLEKSQTTPPQGPASHLPILTTSFSEDTLSINIKFKESTYSYHQFSN